MTTTSRAVCLNRIGMKGRREMNTWRERLGIVFFNGVMWGILFPVMLIGGLALVGGVLDGISAGSAAHDSCLKHATNGYEIRACH